MWSGNDLICSEREGKGREDCIWAAAVRKRVDQGECNKVAAAAAAADKCKRKQGVTCQKVEWYAHARLDSHRAGVHLGDATNKSPSCDCRRTSFGPRARLLRRARPFQCSAKPGFL